MNINVVHLCVIHEMDAYLAFNSHFSLLTNMLSVSRVLCRCHGSKQTSPSLLESSRVETLEGTSPNMVGIEY